MKKLILFVLVLAAGGGGYYYYKVRTSKPDPTVLTQPLSRGDVVDTVGATGTLEAVETVDVGTQVSGVVRELHADFNTIVRKGQVIARLDPQLIETQIEQQTANVARAEADLDRLKVGLADAKQKLDRAQQMSAKQLIPKTDLETAEVNVRSAEAQIKSSEASLVQAKAQLNNQRVNLGYTTITAPIDGIVISRNVDQGQTVAASMNAPTLYVIAADLTKMQVLANIDEADVGRMRPRQRVTFRVDAFPTDTFMGDGRPGPAAAGSGAERRHLLDGDCGAEPGPEAEAGHDRERQYRDRPPQQRAADPERGDAVPADHRDVPGAQPGRAPRARARARWPRRTRRGHARRRSRWPGRRSAGGRSSCRGVRGAPCRRSPCCCPGERSGPAAAGQRKQRRAASGPRELCAARTPRAAPRLLRTVAAPRRTAAAVRRVKEWAGAAAEAAASIRT